jgi:hypothetical protein
VDLSTPPVIPLEADSQAIDRLTIKIIRATTELDWEMESWLGKIGEGGPTRTSGVRAKAFEANLDRLPLTPKQRSRIELLQGDLDPALTVRNALVHGRVEYGVIGAQQHVFLQTLDQCSSGASARHCLTHEQIECAVSAIRQLARQLVSYRNQLAANSGAAQS